MTHQTALIIGAGPAGLTAARELLATTDIRPVILEADTVVGGLSRTVVHDGNRIDIGGHRFFSKSDRVMRWWLDILPLEVGADDTLSLAYRGQRRVWTTDAGLSASADIGGGTSARATATVARADADVDVDPDAVMLVRNRRSRIYFLGKFFDYPVALNGTTLRNLGMGRIARILVSYLRARLRPLPEDNLEGFYVNRFGRVLFEMFFKAYTEKVWGVPCNQISAAWGAQRVKGLSISKTLMNIVARPFRRRSLSQKGTETSLIEHFLYPKFGPGQLWEHVAAEVTAHGGALHLGTRVTKLMTADGRITGVEAETADGTTVRFAPDAVFSTMPVRELIAALDPPAPPAVRAVSDGLVYRDFFTVGVLADRLREGNAPLRDNWIYIQDPDVSLGRIQVFNNWSPHMIADPDKVWLGLEYFCNEGDALWRQSDCALAALAVKELAQVGLVAREDVRDTVVVRMPKAYPAYFGTYDRFDELIQYLGGFENLSLIGRNGMHRYNNQDHSMLTAMTAVENLRTGRRDPANIWAVNTEQEYHESHASR